MTDWYLKLSYLMNYEDKRLHTLRCRHPTHVIEWSQNSSFVCLDPSWVRTGNELYRSESQVSSIWLVKSPDLSLGNLAYVMRDQRSHQWQPWEMGNVFEKRHHVPRWTNLFLLTKPFSGLSKCWSNTVS